jgi:orotidine-5'-phosphate decarboxylase
MFKKWIYEQSREKQTNIVLALDLDIRDREKLLNNSLRVLKEVSDSICAVKINKHLTLPLGLYGGVDKIVEKVHEFNLPAIMDCKINDIGNTNRVIAESYFNIGFDALTASPFIGWIDGLEPTFKIARQNDKGILILVYMSHKGAEEGYGQRVVDSEKGEIRPQYELFAEKALKWKADGAIVGATQTEKMKQIYSMLKGKVPIYSPGVGVQGGDIREAVKNGAEYLIIGRSIIMSNNPGKVAERIREEAWKIVKE